MSERKNGRAAVETMAGAYKEHEAKQGRHVTAEQAKAAVIGTARTEDARADQGHNKNKRKR